jgi:hypothetical protein
MGPVDRSTHGPMGEHAGSSASRLCPAPGPTAVQLSAAAAWSPGHAAGPVARRAPPGRPAASQLSSCRALLVMVRPSNQVDQAVPRWPRSGCGNAFPAALTQAMREGFLGIGAQDNTVVIFSELMDSSSRFLTANADTVYYLPFVDLTQGPMKRRRWRWARSTTCGSSGSSTSDLPGPDRGAGGRFCWCRRAMTDRFSNRGRPLRRALAHEPYAGAGPVVHGERRSRADRRDHQVETQAVPLYARWRGHQYRHPSRRQGPAPRPGTDVPETKFVEATRISLSLRVIDEGSRPGSDAGYRGGCDVEGCAHPS